MSGDNTFPRIPNDEALRLDALSDEFARAWRAGSSPDIADYLQKVDESLRPLSLRELLNVELVLRRSRGESPTAVEYQLRFPEYATLVQKVFQASESRELETIATPPAQFGRGLHVRCPHCHNPIELVAEAELHEINCPSCGDSFSLTSGEASERSTAIPKKFGHYELIEQIGMGAFGVVWKSRDTQLDRLVAVKIPRSGQLNREEVEKFLREARAVAQLRHPNIVSVHEVGRQADTVYLVSDLIQGMTLEQWIGEQKLTARESAKLCIKIAQALQHAHDHGVIHRDLKPQNILMDQSGEPHLTDFGLAKRAVGEITMTMEGQVLGTPAFMSPEQARGESHEADERSDVYSLGVILFRLLTGELPFRGNVRMLLKQILEDDPPAPRQLDNQIPRDIDTICQKCLAKEPARRYATARVLADDLQRFLRDEVIQARPVSRVERTWRWCQRRPFAAALIAGMSSLLVLVAIAAPIAAFIQLSLRKEVKVSELAAQNALVLAEQKKQQAREMAVNEADANRAAQSTLHQLQRSQYDNRLADAFRLYQHDPTGAASVLEDVTICPIDLRDAAWSFLHGRIQNHLTSEARIEFRHQAIQQSEQLPTLWDIQVSHDGRILASESFRRVCVWDTASRQKISEFDLPASAFSADITWNRTPIWLLSPSGEHVFAQAGDENKAEVVAYSTHDGTPLSRTTAFRLTTPRRVPLRGQSFSGEISDYRPQAIAIRDSRLAIENNETLVVWNFVEGKHVSVAVPDKMKLLAVQFEADDQLLVVLSTSSETSRSTREPSAKTKVAAKLISVDMSGEIRNLADLDPHVIGADFSTNANRLICRRRVPDNSSSRDNYTQTLTGYEIQRTDSVVSLKTNFVVSDTANWFLISQNGDYLVLSNDDPQHWVRDAVSGKLLYAPLDAPFGAGWTGYDNPEHAKIRDIAIAPDVEASYYAYGDGAIRKQSWIEPADPISLPQVIIAEQLCDRRDRMHMVKQATAVGTSVITIASTFLLDNHAPASSVICYWSSDRGQLLEKFALPPTIKPPPRSPSSTPVAPQVVQMAVAPDERYLALGIPQLGVYAFDRQRGTILDKALGNTTANATFAPDGSATLGFFATLKSYDVTTGAVLDSRQLSGEAITAVAVLNDGKPVVGTSTGKLYVWPMADGTTRRFDSGVEPIESISASATGERLVVLSGGVVKVVDSLRADSAESAVEIREESPIHAAICSPDGRTVVTLTEYSRLSFWNGDTGKFRGTYMLKHGAETIHFSPDGSRLTVGGTKYGAKLYKLTPSSRI